MKQTRCPALRCRELPPSTPPVSWGALPALLPVTLGLSLLTVELLPCVTLSCWALLGISLLLQLLLWLPGRLGLDAWLLPGGMGLLLLGSLAAWQPLSGSAGYLLTDLTRQLTRISGHAYLEYASSGSPLPALLVLLAFAALLLHEAWRRESLWPAAPLLLAALAAYALGLASDPMAAALLLPGAVLLRLPRSSLPAEGLRLAAVGLCLLLLSGLTALCGDLPQSSSRQLHQALHTLCYDSGSASLPEGELRDLGPWEKSDSPALAITMDQPGRLYLRGGIYETYTGQSWQAASAESRADYADLFYWLHHNEFYGQTQLGDAAALVGRTEDSQLTVENLSACRAHGYLPYGAVGLTETDASLIGDAVLPSVQQFSYLSGTVSLWYQVQSQLVASQQQKGDYVSLERAWAEYVSAQDLQLTQDSCDVLRRQLGEDDESRSLSEILRLIRSYLSESLSYDESVYTFSGDGDFLTYLLESSGAGYSVHYATAATLLLRYFGVPARYVEGYCLTSAQAQQLSAGQRIILTEENAHAWAEYYLEGVGFVPFEVTPGYTEQEDLTLGGSGSGESLTYTPDHSGYTIPQQQPQTQGPRLWSLLAGCLWYVLLLLVPVLLLILLLRRRRLTRPLRRLRAAQGREAVTGLYGYAVYLMSLSGLSPPQASQAALLNQEARFSCHPVTPEQVRWMQDFAAGCLADCRARWHLPRRLYYRWIQCVY